MESDTVKLFFDGSSCPHKGGKAGYGYVIEGYEHGSGEVVGDVQTNNVAEYTALIEGIKKCLELGIHDVHIIGDSQLIIYQVTGKYKVRNETLKGLHKEVIYLLSFFSSFSIEWVRREFNKADEFSR